MRFRQNDWQSMVPLSGMWCSLNNPQTTPNNSLIMFHVLDVLLENRLFGPWLKEQKTKSGQHSVRSRPFRLSCSLFHCSCRSQMSLAIFQFSLVRCHKPSKPRLHGHREAAQTTPRASSCYFLGQNWKRRGTTSAEERSNERKGARLVATPWDQTGHPVGVQLRVAT